MATAFEMFSGDSKILEITVRALGASGALTAVDISGATIRWQLARTANARPPLLTKAIGDGVAIVDGPAGRFEVTLEPEDTDSLSGTYYFEAEMDDGGVISTVSSGNVLIQPDLIDPA